MGWVIGLVVGIGMFQILCHRKKVMDVVRRNSTLLSIVVVTLIGIGVIILSVYAGIRGARQHKEAEIRESEMWEAKMQEMREAEAKKAEKARLVAEAEATEIARILEEARLKAEAEEAERVKMRFFMEDK